MRFVLATPVIRCATSGFMYYSDTTTSPNDPQIAFDEKDAKRFDDQVEAAKQVPVFIDRLLESEHLNQVAIATWRGEEPPARQPAEAFPYPIQIIPVDMDSRVIGE